MSEAKVAIVVPWRPGDPQREKAWAWCREWWEQFEWPIFEVTHPPPAPFNRAWCINEGARRAWPWDVLIAIDADVFEEDPEQVRDGVRRALDHGRLTIPHTSGHDLNNHGTSLLLRGAEGWQKALAKRRAVCTSRVWIMRCDLFAAVGGFDERFRGWGFEDVAAFHSMRNLRGVDQPTEGGIAYHLWHRPSFGPARRTPEWAAGNALAERYLTADRQGWPAIAPILAERTEAERWDTPRGASAPPIRLNRTEPEPSRAVDVIVLTAGRKDYLERTLQSFSEHVSGEIAHRSIQDDSGDQDFGRWLKETYPDWEITTTSGPSGFTKAIRSAWHHEQRRLDGAPYIFHLEEDFTFDRDIDLAEMAKVLEHEPKLAQVALLRGPFFPPEHAAGGIIQEDPKAYTAATDGERTWLEHRKFFTTNPCLYRRSLLKTGWPMQRNSEVAMTKVLIRKGYRFAFLGDGTPWVAHIGEVRTGLGY